MKTVKRTRKVGNFWIDRELLDEGYKPKDILDTEDAIIELPELFESERREQIGWIVCPDCGQKTQVDRRNPVCPICDADREDDDRETGAKATLKRAA